MTDWFEKLRRVNRNLLVAAKEAKADRFLRRSTVEKYADATHFIFELLQNADDQDAAKVEFKFFPDHVEFYHWGNPFTQDDVERITRFGDSGKPVRKIGRHGIGFKSVFAVTDRPEIYCTLDGKPFAFAIEELVVPVALTPAPAQGTETKFVLRYATKVGKTPSADAANDLAKAGPETLMFLNHIEELSWQDPTGAGERFECDRVVEGLLSFERSRHDMRAEDDQKAFSYRIFRRDVELPEGDPSEICVAFRLNDDGKVISEEGSTKLWIYFETEEPSGLRFRLHAPFEHTDNRANIKRKEEFNTYLIRELAELAASSLVVLRDEGRLVRETLNAFPIPADDIPETCREVAAAIWKAAKESKILPTASGSYANPSALYQGTQELRDILSDADLSLLAGEDRAWAVAPGLRHSRIDRLLSHLETPEYKLESLASQLRTASYGGRLEKWLARHDADWMQRLYLVLDDIKGHSATTLEYTPIVRAADDAHVNASTVRFAPAAEQKDPDIEVQGVHLVAPAILAGKKERRQEVEAFLRKIGVKDVDEQDYIKGLLQRYYRQGSRVSDFKAHLRHMERFAARLAANPREAHIFYGCVLFVSEDSDALHAATQLYLDKPLQETGLAAVYGSGGPWAKQKYPLASRYHGVKRVLDFARTLGAIDRLQPQRQGTINHPEHSYLWADYYGAATRMGNSTDIDWIIPDVHTLLARPTVAVSLCLWRSLQTFDRSYFFAQFRHVQTKPIRDKLPHWYISSNQSRGCRPKRAAFSSQKTSRRLSYHLNSTRQTGRDGTISWALARQRDAGRARRNCN
jgi:hypothetical protein